MQTQLLTGLVITSLSVGSFTFAGCTQQRFDTQAPEETATNVQAQTETAPNVQTQEREPDVPYVPTPDEVVAEMLRITKVTKNDVLYDLGSGDGRIVITAAKKFGTRGVGVDINPERIREANNNARRAGVTNRVQFRQQDLFKTDFREATVVTLYLLPEVNIRLRPKLLRELKPGTRIVSHDFDMGDWKPQRVVQVQGPGRDHTLYYWVVPKNIPANLK